jgi:O-methyltransferase
MAMGPFRSTLRRLRARVPGTSGPTQVPPMDILSGLEPSERDLLEVVRPYTLTSPERIVATVDAVAHVVRRGVPGAFAECGVWRGGSVLAMVLQLQRMGVTDRDLYLYDTFEGMTQPTEQDTSRFHEPAMATWEAADREGRRPWQEYFEPTLFNLDDVKRLLLATGYPEHRFHFVVGPVEETLPDRAPGEVAVLRLDTDWYEPTKHELEHLYPRLADGGVLIIDDYGHWEGARRAVDEYFEATGSPLLLHRTDYTGRAGIKH